jgi:hypothetical protein
MVEELDQPCTTVSTNAETWTSLMASTLASSPRVLVGDYSHWNGSAVDFQKAFDAGMKGCILRAGSINNITGVCYDDYHFLRNVIAVKQVEIFPFGTYWYYRPNRDTLLQARYYANLVNGAQPNLPSFIDVEFNQGVSPALFAYRLREFAVLFKQLTGKYPGIYTRQSFWDVNVGPDALLKSLLLWAARHVTLYDYTDLSGPWYDGRYRFRDWPSQDWPTGGWWQFGADNNRMGAKYGNSSDGDPDMDLNYVNSSVDEFYALAGIQIVPHAGTMLEYANAIDPFLRNLGYRGVKPPLT